MKKIIPILMMLICLASVSFAATVVNLDPQDILKNNTYQTSSTVYPNINVTGNQSLWTCILYTNENGTSGAGAWRAVQTDSGVLNNTNTNFSYRQNVLERNGTPYTWNVFCSGATDVNGAWGTSVPNYTYGVDLTEPSITINTPTDFSWDNNGYVTWNLTVVDNNPAQCVLYSNLNNSLARNTTDAWGLKETYTFANNSWFNFTYGQSTNKWNDNGTGVYKWYVICNDSAGQLSFTDNITVLVDSSQPSAFDFNLTLFKTNHSRGIQNATYGTDHEPYVGWSLSSDGNFSHYEIIFYKNNYYNTTYSAVNVTSVSTLTTRVARLLSDTMYKIWVTAYDLAGNAKNITTLNYQYTTDSTGYQLDAGWNIVGNVGNKFNLSELREWTDASTVSLWNGTHEFISHVEDGDYGTQVVYPGDAVLIYVDADTNLSDLVWNTSTGLVVDKSYNLTNQTASDWNLLMQTSTTAKRLQLVDSYFNCNVLDNGCAAGANNYTRVPYLSYYNNTAAIGSKYVPYVANWSINNDTTLDYGECVWIYYTNESGSYKGAPQAVNWTNM